MYEYIVGYYSTNEYNNKHTNHVQIVLNKKLNSFKSLKKLENNLCKQQNLKSAMIIQTQLIRRIPFWERWLNND